MNRKKRSALEQLMKILLAAEESTIKGDIKDKMAQKRGRNCY